VVVVVVGGAIEIPQKCFAGGPESGNRVKQDIWDNFKQILTEHNVNSISRCRFAHRQLP
jgi:hypothetical protein